MYFLANSKLLLPYPAIVLHLTMYNLPWTAQIIQTAEARVILNILVSPFSENPSPSPSLVFDPL